MKTIGLPAVIAATLGVIRPLASWAADQPADAQQTPPGLQEVVVTAQKRSEDVDKVPISVAVYDQEQMDRQGVRSLADIYQTTPGVDFREQGAFNHLSIRGISSGAGAATTAIYLDDVPIQTRFPALNLVGSASPRVFDLDRVEVLRGPQGTYFGAGAEAGAIRFITPQPSVTANSGYTRVGFNGTDVGGIGYEGGIAVGGPIIDNELGYRVSASHARVGGYVDHYSTVAGGYRQADSNWSDSDQVKAALLFQPTESVKITPQLFLQNIYTHDLSSFDPDLSDPSSSSFVSGGLLLAPDRNQLAVPQLKMEFQMGKVTLTSVSAYLYREEQSTYDYSVVLTQELGLPPPSNPIDFTAVPYTDRQNTVSQEIRLQNSDPDAKFKWVVGGYYSLAHQETIELAVEPNLNNYLLAHTGKGVVGTFGCPPGMVPGSLGYYCGPTGLIQPGDLSFVGLDHVHDRQLAVFGQIDYEVLPGLTLTVGARHAKESSNFSLLYEGPLDAGNVFTPGSEKDTVTTPKYGISYQIDNNNMVYGTVSKGNRLGGANAPFFDLPGCTQELDALGLPRHPSGYDPDYVWNYEVGTKNRLFDDRVHFELSAFHMKWQALQQLINVNACATQITANIGSAKSDGFDMALNAAVTHDLLVGLSVGYSNAVIGQTVGIPGGITFVNKGDQIDPFHSPWTVATSIEYNFNLLDKQPLYVRVDDEYHSKNPGPFTFNNPDAPASYNPLQPVNPATNLLNARIGAQLGGWDVAVFGTNLANSHPLLNVTLPTQLAPLGHDYTLPSRTVGITANYHW